MKTFFVPLFWLLFFGSEAFGQSVDLARFGSFSPAERLRFIRDFDFWSKDSAALAQTFAALLPIADEKKDHRSAFALRFFRFQYFAVLKPTDAELRAQLAEMRDLAEKNGLETEKIAARGFSILDDFYHGRSSREQTYAEALRFFSDAERHGLEQLADHRPDALLNGIAGFFLEMGDLEQAQRILLAAEPFLEPTTLKMFDFTLALNRLQYCFEQSGDLPRAIETAKRIIAANEKFARDALPKKEWRAIFWQGLASLDVAKMLVETGDLAEGERWAERGWALSRVAENTSGRHAMRAEFAALQVLILIKMKVGKTAEVQPLIERSRVVFEKSEAIKKNQDRSAELKFLKNQALFCENRGDWAAAVHFSKQARSLEDSLLKSKNAQKFEQLKLRHEAEKYEEKIRLVEREKAVQVMLRNGALLIFLLTMALGWSLFSKNRAKRRLAEAELLVANEQLGSLAASFQEKSAALERAAAEIEKMSATDEREKLRAELTAQTILTAEDWARFRAIFEKVNPGFEAAESALFPNLTASELRLAMLDKLELSDREIANLLGISEASVRQTRWRLRKKTQA